MNSTKLKRGLVIALMLFVLGAVASVGGIVGVFWWFGRGVAEFDEQRLKNYRPSQVTRVLSRDGELIGEIFEQRRMFIEYQDIPAHVENAFLAAEDADFYKHEGMDYMGMVRALLANVKAGEIRQGASTITQQVVKIFMLSPERTFERKVQELLLARRLEQAFTKKEILELYLNEIYLGHGRYGVEAASRFYFGKGVAEIDLGQAAMLATLPKAPGRDSPLQNPERALGRRIYVLQQMMKHGFTSPEDAQRYIDSEDLGLADEPEHAAVISGAEEFVDAVKAELMAHYGDELATLGGEVVTTVSLPLQQAARRAMLEGLTALDARNGYGRGKKPAKQVAKDKALAQGKGPLAIGRELPAVIVSRPDGVALPPDGFTVQVGDQDVFVRVPEGSRYDDPDLSLDEQFTPGAITQVRIIHGPAAEPHQGLPAGWSEAVISAGPEAAVVLLDVPTGEVLAMLGGSHYGLADFNRATQAKRPPGSAFKPFVYGAALLSNAFTAATLVSDSPEDYETWKPNNFSRDVYLGDIRLREALQKSVNTVAIKLADSVGVEQVIAFAQAAGVESELPKNLSIALGTGEVTPFELARGYLTLARSGDRIEPSFIKEVRAPGNRGWVPERASEQVLPEDVLFVLTSMMESVVQEGTGTRAKKLGRPVAGKTGTSPDFHDAWFGGFTPSLVAVTWVGFDRPRKLGKGETGGKAALPIWLKTMEAAVEGEPEPFTVPPSVSVRRIDAASGLLAPTGAAAEGYEGEVIEEYFVAGTEPLDEAIPAALPTGDVLLDLYGEEPGAVSQQAYPEEPEAALEPARRSDVEPAAAPSPGRALPSLDDEI